MLMLRNETYRYLRQIQVLYIKEFNIKIDVEISQSIRGLLSFLIISERNFKAIDRVKTPWAIKFAYRQMTFRESVTFDRSLSLSRLLK